MNGLVEGQRHAIWEVFSRKHTNPRVALEILRAGIEGSDDPEGFLEGTTFDVGVARLRLSPCKAG